MNLSIKKYFEKNYCDTQLKKVFKPLTWLERIFETIFGHNTNFLPKTCKIVRKIIGTYYYMLKIMRLSF